MSFSIAISEYKVHVFEICVVYIFSGLHITDMEATVLVPFPNRKKPFSSNFGEKIHNNEHC